VKARIAGGAAVLAALVGLGLTLHRKLDTGITEAQRGARAEAAALQQQNERLRLRLEASESRVGDVQAQVQRLRADYDESHAVHARALREAESRLESLDRLETLGSAMQRRMETWDQRLRESATQTQNLQTDLEAVRRSVGARQVNFEKLYHDLLHPSVQINARDAVGGGTLFHTEPLGASGAHLAHILTAYHVIQKSLGERGRRPEPIEARLYREDGSVLGNFTAEVVSHSEPRDIALLRVRVGEPIKTLARLAGRPFLKTVRVFTPVYAVGCPLGHDPIPTLGEISSLNKKVGGENFWMVNAPTIFGNSGGGVFHRETHELIGVSAMICTYDNIVSTPVPHLSIVTSLATVYDWLDAQGLAYLYQPAVQRAQ
jgi:hypothetical protein